ncbi:MAG: Do family serine endopeptidase [Candidatus Eiseniibacteriota bacterium]
MKPSMLKFLGGGALVAVGLTAGLMMSIRLDLGDGMALRNDVSAAPPGATLLATPESPFVAVAERVVPGVVAIATKSSRNAGGAERFHPWGDMFEDLFPDDPRGDQPEPRRQRGSGSGFFMDRHEGYLLTNNHVVDGAADVTVTLADGSELEAAIVGQDPATDVAVLKVDPKDYAGTLPALAIGDSDHLRVGDWVMAIGNPFGQLAGTVTAGIVSALGRNELNIMGNTPAFQNFIQTDASINFGNSGGPLVNIRGEVVGMNTAINAAGQGIGFAIPINLASRIAEELIEKGKVVRGYLGILPGPLTRDLADAFDVEEGTGILVNQVLDDTPAAAAGLQSGDIILELNGGRVTDVHKFRLEVADARVGEEIRLVVLREGKQRNVTVVLAERPDAVVASSQETESEVWAGLHTADVSSREAARLVDDPEAEGVVVVKVDPDSPADDAGIRPGDIIREVGNLEIADLADYQGAVRKYADKKAVAVLVQRGEQTLYVGLKP